MTVTTDTALDVPDGMYSGVMVATGVDSPVRVPIAFTKEAPARVIKAGGCWFAFVQHPVGATFVSLKAKAQDADGNSVEQTIIRAYGLK